MWENILKRRPLKINKPQKVTSPEEIDEIKENVVSFLTDVEITELYMEYLKSLPDDAEPSHNLNQALFSLMNYTNRALDRTRSTQRFIFGAIEISFIELLNNFYSRFINILQALEKIPSTELDRETLSKVIKKLDDFIKEHEEYLIQQNKLYLAERGKLFG